MLIATRRSILCYYVLLRDPTGKIWNGEGGGLPYISYMTMCRYEGAGFQAVEIVIVIKKRTQSSLSVLRFAQQDWLNWCSNSRTFSFLPVAADRWTETYRQV